MALSKAAETHIIWTMLILGYGRGLKLHIGQADPLAGRQQDPVVITQLLTLT